MAFAVPALAALVLAIRNSVGWIFWLPCRGNNFEITSLEIECDVHQADQRWHFNQRSNHGGERRARVDSKNRHGYRNGKFEIIAGSRKRERRRFRVVCAQLPPHVERNQKHYD